MSSPFRSLLAVAALVAIGVHAADLPKDSPFSAGGNATPAAQNESLEFAGVSTVGQKTMINLFDRQQKHSLWIRVGDTSDGITVVSYDGGHDQVKVRQNGSERTLSLRAASTATGPSVAAPVMAPALAATPVDVAPAAPAPAAASSTESSSAAMTPQTRARQEEEARMLVSDLLEIGIAQRKAYEDAQRRAASGQPPQPAAAAPTSPAPTATGSTPASQ